MNDSNGNFDFDTNFKVKCVFLNLLQPSFMKISWSSNVVLQYFPLSDVQVAD